MILVTVTRDSLQRVRRIEVEGHASESDIGRRVCAGVSTLVHLLADIVGCPEPEVGHSTLYVSFDREHQSAAEFMARGASLLASRCALEVQVLEAVSG